jgi:hypothetical protein
LQPQSSAELASGRNHFSRPFAKILSAWLRRRRWHRRAASVRVRISVVCTFARGGVASLRVREQHAALAPNASRQRWCWHFSMAGGAAAWWCIVARDGGEGARRTRERRSGCWLLIFFCVP